MRARGLDGQGHCLASERTWLPRARPARTRLLVGLGLMVPCLLACQAAPMPTVTRPGGRPPSAVALMARTSFSLAPAQLELPPLVPLLGGAPGGGLLPPGPLPAVAVAPAPVSVGHVVRLLGRALVAEDLRGSANVSGGYVTGTPVLVRDARSGRQLAEGITFYDGSFSVEVRFVPEGLPVIVSTMLVDAADQKLTTPLTAPAMLRAGQGEQRISLTPGSTALTSFLQAVAGLDADDKLPADGPDLAAAVGPKLGALIAGIDDGERDSFSRLAESAPEMREASSVQTLKEAIRRFVGRIAVRRN
ncbi:MAG: hypothetical protein VKP62_04235 [Candidatus Sericytochromatia bacterium]|nr:hypothetical protein [Candidatus Sericytochromatia bacterium]